MSRSDINEGSLAREGGCEWLLNGSEGVVTWYTIGTRVVVCFSVMDLLVMIVNFRASGLSEMVQKIGNRTSRLVSNS